MPASAVWGARPGLHPSLPMSQDGWISRTSSEMRRRPPDGRDSSVHGIGHLAWSAQYQSPRQARPSLPEGSVGAGSNPKTIILPCPIPKGTGWARNARGADPCRWSLAWDPRGIEARASELARPRVRRGGRRTPRILARALVIVPETFWNSARSTAVTGAKKDVTPPHGSEHQISLPCRPKAKTPSGTLGARPRLTLQFRAQSHYQSVRIRRAERIRGRPPSELSTPTPDPEKQGPHHTAWGRRVRRCRDPTVLTHG